MQAMSSLVAQGERDQLVRLLLESTPRQRLGQAVGGGRLQRNTVPIDTPASPVRIVRSRLPNERGLRSMDQTVPILYGLPGL